MAHSGWGSEAMGHVVLLGARMLKYNPKIDYLMCKWMTEPKRNHKEFVLRAVFFDQAEPKTQDQLKICRYRNTFKLLISHEVDSAIDIFFSNNRPIESFDYRHINEYLKRVPDFDLFVVLLKNDKLLTVLSVLLFNAIRVRNNLIPIIFQTRHLDLIMDYIENGQTHEAERLYELSCILTERFLMKKSSFSKDGIMEKFTLIRDELKLGYNIDKVYIYGSIARDDANEYSDLDVVVVTGLAAFDDDYVFSLQKVIEEQVKMPIDLHLFSEKIDYSVFDKKIREDMLQII